MTRTSIWLDPPDRRTRWTVATVFALSGAYFLRNSTAIPAVEWMLQYRPEDFKSWSDLGVFLRQLRSGIPPLLAIFEISTYLSFDSLELATVYVYRASFLLAFMLPPLVFARTRLQMAVSGVTCLIFLWAAPLVVWQNPQTYDVYLPLTMLLAVFCIGRAGRAASISRAVAWAAAAGFATSLMELLRPFGLFLVPVLILHAWMAWHGKRRATFLALAVPLLLLSGGWHLKLLIHQDGQIVWSNHGGNNLYNGWSNQLPEQPETIPLKPAEYPELYHVDFLGTGDFRFLRLDSEAHTLNSKTLGRAVTQYVLSHPLESATHVLKGVRRLLAPQVVVFQIGDEAFRKKLIEENRPRSPVIPMYRLAVWITSGFMFLNVFLLAAYIVRRRSLAIFGQPEPPILMLAFLMLCAFIVGERGEEARFILSLLPLFGVYASMFMVTRNDASTTGRPWKLAWLPENKNAATSPETEAPYAQ